MSQQLLEVSKLLASTDIQYSVISSADYSHSILQNSSF